MRLISGAVIVLVCLTSSAYAQQRAYKSRATIETSSDQSTPNQSTLEANDPRPLYQATIAIGEEYGWRIDYEDPVYTQKDTVDDTAPKWSAEHGGRRVSIPRGGSFSTNFRNATPGNERSKYQLLSSVVSDYNKTDNPGRFKVIGPADGSYAVIPVEGSILDQTIRFPSGTRNLLDELEEITKALNLAGGPKVKLGALPHPRVFEGVQVEEDGHPAVARAKLIQVLSVARYEMVWRLLYGDDLKVYYLNLFLAAKAETSSDGVRLVQPIPRPASQPNQR